MEKDFFFFFLGTYISKQTNKKVAKNKITRGGGGSFGLSY
jgi:hypothetical protein